MARERRSMQDIASACGVSVSTVSRVLSNEPGVSVGTRRRVLSFIQSGGFVKRERRRHLSRALLRLVVVIPEAQQIEMNQFFDPGELFTSINNSFHMEKKRIEMITQSALEARLEDSPGDIDGLICAFGDLSAAGISRLSSLKVPYIFLNRTPAGESYVSCNHVKGMLALGTHLARNGYRRIGYLGCASIPVNRDRERGYRLAMMEAGSRAGSALIHTVEDIGGVNEAAARFFIRKKCDAVMAFNDNFAIRLVQALARLDVLVPRDMAVTGFDNAPARAHFTPSITTISLSTYEMGYLAARWLRENILHRQARPLRLEVEGVLMEGASTRRRRTR